MPLYIIQSQGGQVLDKHLNWVDGVDRSQLFSTPHRDVALNQLIELNTRDIQLRARVVACDCDDRGNPVVACQPMQAAG